MDSGVEMSSDVDLQKEYDAAVAFYVAGQYAEAAPKFMLAADRGNVLASMYLVLCYFELTDNSAHRCINRFVLGEAREGSPEAQCWLGCFFLTGIGCLQDYGQASVWLNKAQAGGFKLAGRIIEHCLHEDVPAQEQKEFLRSVIEEYMGEVQELARKSSIEFLEVIDCQHEEAESTRQEDNEDSLVKDKALELYTQEKYGMAFQLMQKYADEGDEVACYICALCLHMLDDAKDDELIVQYMWKAAKAGVDYAQYWMGKFKLFGTHCEADYEEAVYWIERSVAQGDTDSYFLLGRCYFDGCGYEQDREKGKRYIEEGAAFNDRCAMVWLGVYYFGGYDDEHEPDVKLGLEWFHAAYDCSGIVSILELLVDYYYANQELLAEDNEAGYYLKLAVEEGWFKAGYCLFQCYRHGWGGLGKNEGKAAEYRELADICVRKSQFEKFRKLPVKLFERQEELRKQQAAQESFEAAVETAGESLGLSDDYEVVEFDNGKAVGKGENWFLKALFFLLFLVLYPFARIYCWLFGKKRKKSRIDKNA